MNRFGPHRDSTAVAVPTRSEWPQTRKRNQPRPRLMETTRVDGVKPPQTPKLLRYKTPSWTFRLVSPLPVESSKPCWATTDNTSRMMRLNSSKQAQAPLAANP